VVTTSRGRRAARPHGSALLVFLCPFLILKIRKFSYRRMKTLATLSANGFGAVYIEVVSVILVDQLGRFFLLLLAFPRLQLYTVRFHIFFFFFFFVHWHCPVCGSGREGTVC